MTDFINNFINSMTQKLLIIGSSLNIEPNIVQQVNPVIANDTWWFEKTK